MRQAHHDHLPLKSNETLISLIIPSHRDDGSAHATMQAILSQSLPTACAIEAILVEDGYRGIFQTEGRTLLHGRFRTIQLDKQSGRAVARNAGASAAAGDILLFVDADCIPSDNRWLVRLLAELEHPEVVASGGLLIGAGEGFWLRYQSDVREKRTARHSNAQPALTTANLAVKHNAFKRIGGFDPRYRGYGFEDRDLLLRLAQEGVLALVKDAPVVHRDIVRLAEVTRKLHEAGATTSAVFSSDHPHAYRALGYAAIDCTLHSWMRPIVAILGPIAMSAAPAIDHWLERLPYSLGKTLVKAVSALAFLYGTSRRSKSA